MRFTNPSAYPVTVPDAGVTVPGGADFDWPGYDEAVNGPVGGLVPAGGPTLAPAPVPAPTAASAPSAPPAAPAPAAAPATAPAPAPVAPAPSKES